MADILKVSSKSNPNLVASAIAGTIREKGSAELQSIGAGALNQAVKAVAIARSFMMSSDVQLVCIPSFTEVKLENSDERTAIRLIVEPR